MKIILNNNDLNRALNDVSNLGFVPTMGSIHKGHISLIKKSKKECKKTIVSIFVNPKQFNNKKDYKNYPRNIKKDLSILKQNKVNYVFLPSYQDVFKSKSKQKISINKNNRILCAKYRKGHFEGVLDVMDKLTYLVKPKKIYMGEKDYQQLYLVKKFITKKYKIKIISCRTIRNKNKLALSSRNFHLDKKDFITAEKISQNLFFFKKNINKEKNIIKSIDNKKIELIRLFNIKIEYLELRNLINFRKTKIIKNSRLFFAYYLNNIRLIDNY